MVLQLPDIGIHTRIRIEGGRPMDDARFYDFCMEKRSLVEGFRLELEYIWREL